MVMTTTSFPRGGLGLRGRVVFGLIGLACAATTPLALAQDPELISVRAGTNDPAGRSHDAVISDDGRFVTFLSEASSLVTGPQSLTGDVYIRDRTARVTERISVGLNGALPDGNSGAHDVSADGRFVVFESEASNLVPSDTNGRKDVFLRDRLQGTTRRISTGEDGTQLFGYDSELPSITPNGRFVCFHVHAQNAPFSSTRHYLAVRDRWTGALERVNVWNDGTPLVSSREQCSMSADGRYVAFSSPVRSIVPFNPDPAATGSFRQIFVRDRLEGRTEVVSVSSGGALATNENDTPVISGDGRYVFFVTYAANLVPNDTNQALDVVGHDRLTGTTGLVSIAPTGMLSGSFTPATNSDGRFVSFPAFFENSLRVFVRDRVASQTKQVTTERCCDFRSGRGALSADGRYLAFEDAISNNVYVQDLGDGRSYQMYLRPLAIEYGLIKVGSVLKKGFTLANPGSVPLPIEKIELLGPDRSQYTLKSYCGSIVPVDGRCWISVAFAPTKAGETKANLHVVAGGIDRHRALRGTGLN
jgi:Tol biopolymer transport system component